MVDIPSRLVEISSYAPDTNHWWAVPLVGVVGAGVAIFSVVANRKIARMRATLDLIERSESSQHYLDIRKSFKKLQNKDTIERVCSPKNEDDENIRRTILAYMNH